MCGILGAYLPTKNGNVDRAVAAMKHRGPDEEGVYISANNRVVIAHARLSLVDLAEGQQPFLFKGLVVAVNGELYDYLSLKKDLEGKGHLFHSKSDSELVVHLYRQYGLSFVDYLRGEFAIVLWDEKQQRLIAVRDRFGIKPLYYALTAAGVCFASEAKALFAMGIVRPQWDEASYYAVASRQYLSPEKSLFQGVEQVRPGHLMIYSEGCLNAKQYWDLNYPSALPSAGNEETVIGDFQSRLQDCVKQRVTADVPVCFHLSGGLDSTSLVALGSQLQASVKCFTVSFDNDTYDELKNAQSSADFFGADLEVVKVSTKDILEHLGDAVYFSEGLGINGHFTAKYLLNKQIKKSGFSIAISGEGADELLLGYPHWREDLYRADNKFIDDLFSSNEASQGIMLGEGPCLDLSAIERALGFIPSFMKAKASLGYKVNTLLSDDFLDAQVSRDCYLELLASFDFEKQLKNRSNLDKSVYLWIKTALAQYILRTLGDGCEMAHSVEGRVPFLDHKLFEYCRSLHLNYKIRNKTEKYLLREAMKKWIPRDVYLRQKHPFMAPPQSDTLEIQSVMRDLINSHSFRKLNVYSKKKIEKLLDKLPQMTDTEKKAWDPVIFTIMTTLHMQYRFMEGRL